MYTHAQSCTCNVPLCIVTCYGGTIMLGRSYIHAIGLEVIAVGRPMVEL